MKDAGSSRDAWLAALFLAVFLCAASSSPRAADCQSSVTTGFAGDLNAVYGDSGGGDSGGAGGGADGGGDAGAGAGEGKVLGGQMTIMRLSDATLLGTAPTDSQAGLVTVKYCAKDLPVLVTLTGQPGARYFDEATGQLSDFGAGKVLHALIDVFDENVGVSPLTEAAYRYALNNFLVNPADVRSGRIPLASNGSVAGLSIGQVRAANTIVLNEINRLQTANMKLVSVKSLPTPIDSGSANTSLPDNRYGMAAVVLGGLVEMGARFLPQSQNPALDVGEQLARDLTDGKIDGFALDGQAAAGPGVAVAYDAVRLPIAASVGANNISARFGAATTLLRATPVSEQTFAGSSALNRCTQESETASLTRDGTIALAHTGCSGTTVNQDNFATQVGLVEGSGVGSGGVLPRTFFARQDGSVWGWGDTLCGLLGNGEREERYQSDPIPIAGISHVTSIASGAWFTIVRDDSGSVFSWGLDYLGELGRGASPSASVSCENDYTSPDFKFEQAALVPARIPGLADIVSVTTDSYSPAALDKGGNLFQWGLIPTGWDFTKPQAGYHGEYVAQPVPALVTGLPKAIAVAASYAMKMALTADGTLWGWGPNVIGNFGDGTLTPHLAPTPVPALGKVVEIAAGGDSPFVALLQDGTIRYWGGCCLQSNGSIPSNVEKTPIAPAAGNTRLYSATLGNFVGTLPAIRHIKGSGGKVLLYGADGSLLQFPKSSQENSFVVLSAPPPNYEGLWWKSPAGSESGWGINLSHQGDVIFATWFTYDAAGKPWWLAMTASKTAQSTYAGTLYETHGPAFNATPFDPAAVTPTPVGSGTLTFHDAFTGTFAYAVNGASQTKAITRQVFGLLPICTFGLQKDLTATTNYQDLWWAAPGGSESGWGVNLTHQSDMIFATWFTYALDGTPLWLSATTNKSAAGVYAGTIYETNGPPFNAVPFDPSRVTALAVGTLTLTFANGNAGTLAYTVNGIAQAKQIVRQVFRSPGTICQ